MCMSVLSGFIASALNTIFFNTNCTIVQDGFYCELRRKSVLKVLLWKIEFCKNMFLHSKKLQYVLFSNLIVVLFSKKNVG